MHTGIRALSPHHILRFKGAKGKTPSYDDAAAFFDGGLTPVEMLSMRDVPLMMPVVAITIRRPM